MLRLFRIISDTFRNNIFSLNTRFWFMTIIFKYYIMRRLHPLIREMYNYIERLPEQKKLIYDRNFDALIILDACRYDVFSQVIFDYLDGTLIPVRSPASITIDWLNRVWGNKVWNDIVYVSASPMVNKRGLLRSFDARKKFLEIIEVWDWGWDKELSTVPPYKVNLGVKLAITKLRLKGLKYGIDYKMIVHYVQPHAPYIIFRDIISYLSKSEISNDIIDIALRKFGYFHGKFSIDHILLSILKEYLKDKRSINQLLYKAYEENLRWALKYVAKLVDEVGGRVILTADHGELLGEYGLYFHMDLPFPQLRIVPWFIVK